MTENDTIVSSFAVERAKIEASRGDAKLIYDAQKKLIPKLYNKENKKLLKGPRDDTAKGLKEMRNNPPMDPAIRDASVNALKDPNLVKHMKDASLADIKQKYGDKVATALT